MTKNFLGMESHPSDQYLHWSSSIEDAVELRKLWDEIPLNLNHSTMWKLFEKIQEYDRLDAADTEAGEAL